MFIKYRIGGGADSNVGPNVLKSLGEVFMITTGEDSTINLNVLLRRQCNMQIHISVSEYQIQNGKFKAQWKCW